MARDEEHGAGGRCGGRRGGWGHAREALQKHELMGADLPHPVRAEKATTASSEIYSAPSSMGTRPGEPKVLAELEEEETIGTMIASSLCN